MCGASPDTILSQQKHETYRWRGNVIQAATALNTVLFCTCSIFFKDNTSIFDATWAKDGFCVSNASIPYWTSHDLCLYADFSLAAVCGVLYFMLHTNEGMKQSNEYVFFNIFGIAAHGLAHGAFAVGLRDEESSAFLEKDIPYYSAMGDKSPMEVLQDQVPVMLFWLGLLKATMPQTSVIGILPLSLLSILGSIFIKQSLQFTYVQTVLLIVFSINQLCRPKEDKGFAYYMYGLLVSLPLGIVGWMESTMCSSSIIHVGGHLVYDAYIPLSQIAFYLTCYFNRRSETAKVKTA